MEEKYLEVILKTLGEKIDELERTVRVLRYEKKELEEELKLFKSPTMEVAKNG